MANTITDNTSDGASVGPNSISIRLRTKLSYRRVVITGVVSLVTLASALVSYYLLSGR